MTTTPQSPLDVVVLGATVAGLTAALELARAGADVEVLDPGPATRGGLGVASLLQDRLGEVQGRHGPSAVADYLEAMRSARDYLASLAPASDLGWDVLPAYAFVADANHGGRVDELADVLGGFGEETREAPRDLLPGFEPAAAIELQDQATVDPDRHLAVLVSAAQAAGVRVSRPVTVTRFIPSGVWQVRLTSALGDRVLHARHVIDTNGVSPWGWNAYSSLRFSPVVVAELPRVPRAVHLFLDTPVALLRPHRGHLEAIGHAVTTERETTATAELIRWLRVFLGANPVQVRTQPLERPVDVLPLVGALPILQGAWMARGFGYWETLAATAAGLQLAGGIRHGERMPWTPARLPANPLPALGRFSRHFVKPTSSQTGEDSPKAP